MVALCSVEGTKLLGGPCCASGWGVLVEGLGAGERDLARQASQETEEILATYLLDGLGDQVRRVLCFGAPLGACKKRQRWSREP